MNTEKVMGVLREVEWVAPPIGWGVCGYQSSCPCCRKWKDDGHAGDCKLAALLGEGEKEKEWWRMGEAGRSQEQIDPLGIAVLAVEMGSKMKDALDALVAAVCLGMEGDR